MNNSYGYWESNILWGNWEAEVLLENASTLVFHSGCLPKNSIHCDLTSTLHLDSEYVLHVNPKLDSAGRLRPGSPCIDSSHLIDFGGELDIDNNPRVQNEIQDIGAYEYPVYESPYLTAFMISQGFVLGQSIDGIDEWKVSDQGSASVNTVFYTPIGNTTLSSYQKVTIGSSTTLFREFEFNKNKVANKTLRISCIPSDNSFINIIYKKWGEGPQTVASLEFRGQDKQIYILSNNSYTATGKYYNAIASGCRSLLDDLYNDSYDNPWIEFEIL
jgi:hypothetical protein